MAETNSKTDEQVIDLPELMSVVPGDAPDTFVGQPESYGALGIYGGHFIGQALAAGLETVEEEKLTQSLHAYFLNPGNPGLPIQYAVTRLKEGRGTDIRSIIASQDGKQVFQMTASFKMREGGDKRQKLMPSIAAPEELQKQHDEGKPQFRLPMMVADRATLLLAVDSFVPAEFVPGREPVIQLWMKSNQERTLTDRQHQCVLAFLSDGPLMFNSVLPHGIPFKTHRLTSLDHSAWFHDECDTADWMLYDQRSTAAADGRGMNEGEVFAADGRLIMTCAQESMLRAMGER